MGRREPQPGDWAVIEGWSYEIALVDRVTAQMVWTKADHRSRLYRQYRDKLIASHPDRAAIEKLIEQLKSAKAECRQREASARVWLEKRKAELIAKLSTGPQAPGDVE